MSSRPYVGELCVKSITSLAVGGRKWILSCRIRLARIHVRLKELRSDFPGAGAVCDVQALQDGGNMNFHCARAHLKLSRDLLVGHTFHEEFENFELTTGELGLTLGRSELWLGVVVYLRRLQFID